MASISKDQWPRVGELYLAGLSMRAVAEKMHGSLDAVTYVLRRLGIPRRSFREANRITFASKKPSFTVRKSVRVAENELSAMGAMLYWAEGHKTARATGIDFANSDPRMVALFVKFLRSRYCLDEKRLRVYMYCYANQPTNDLRDYWSTLLKIPREQFTKPYVRDNPKKGVRQMPYGLVHIRYSDKKLLLDVLNLIESYRSKYRVGTQVVKGDAL